MSRRKINITKPFFIKDDKIELFASETAYGNYAVAILNRKFYHLGDQKVDIMTAVKFWEQLNNVILTTSEIEFIIEDNPVTKE